MFNLRWTTEADAKYKKLKASAEARRKKRDKQKTKKSSQAEGLFKQVAKTIKFLKENPRHPSLNTHEYSAIANPFDKSVKVFEAYAQNKTPGAYRVFWCYAQTKKTSPSSRLLHIRSANQWLAEQRLFRPNSCSLLRWCQNGAYPIDVASLLQNVVCRMDVLVRSLMAG